MAHAITGLSVSDVDAGEGTGEVQVTLSVTHGTIALAQTSGLTFDAGTDGTATMTVTGLLADVNAAIASLTYTPDQDYNGADQLSLSVNDLGNTGAGGTLSDVETIDIHPTTFIHTKNEAARLTQATSSITTSMRRRWKERIPA